MKNHLKSLEVIIWRNTWEVFISRSNFCLSRIIPKQALRTLAPFLGTLKWDHTHFPKGEVVTCIPTCTQKKKLFEFWPNSISSPKGFAALGMYKKYDNPVVSCFHDEFSFICDNSQFTQKSNFSSSFLAHTMPKFKGRFNSIINPSDKCTTLSRNSPKIALKIS